MNLNKAILLIVLAFFTVNIQAQNKTTDTVEKLSLDSGTIESQFEYITKNSNNWTNPRGQAHEVIKIQSLSKLKGNTIDSLKAIHKTLKETKAIITKQEDDISKLKLSLTSAQNNLKQTNTEKDAMSFFGLQMSKDNYNKFMWVISALLFALVLFFMYKFKKSNTITKEAKMALYETEEEFEEHRRIALEREQKVRRQLQDLIIKHKNSN